MISKSLKCTLSEQKSVLDIMESMSVMVIDMQSATQVIYSQTLFSEVQANINLVNSDYVTKYLSCWHSANKPIYIQMEYYEYNRKYFIQLKNTTFNRYPSYNITIHHIEYFIASEIFIELIHGLDYLHSQRILHRDLKESNILIDKKAAIFEGSSLVDRPMGTGNYMAHEAYQGYFKRQTDVFALGQIASNLFNKDVC
ncbi:unnamed protein product [Oppiella nova]|uniref:non-specific serine/threonine protein kinase n=1 Tax=Oppiella nova TaxID=334625 RepID=A0A7R9MG90_9ACAR|nr:unnamed protein product [Oppiella nova]CAG2176507.1 unnamed protein product [Oppiella nova]